MVPGSIIWYWGGNRLVLKRMTPTNPQINTTPGTWDWYYTATIDNMSLISQVEEWMYFEDDLANKISSWARENCDTFTAKDGGSYEHPPEHMHLFNQYCAQFECMITGFLQINQLDIGKFWEEIRREYDLASSSGSKKKNANSTSSTFASVLLAATEFGAFCEMMFDAREGRDVVFCPPLIACEEDTAMDEEDQEMAMYRAAEGKSSYDDHYDEGPGGKYGDDGSKMAKGGDDYYGYK